MNITEAKKALDKVIKKGRVHLYKPIQIAEILYRHRVFGNINLADIETYRVESKRWRDNISSELVGTRCSSSAKFQDNLFDENAVPPDVLVALGAENVTTGGAVEAYIYRQFDAKHSQLQKILEYCRQASPADFEVQNLINSFRSEPGLKRSLGKVYEIIVYSLFITIIDALEVQVKLSVNLKKLDIFHEFQDFTQSVMQLNLTKQTYTQRARVFRVGVTNAADRGLDMYSNWGPAIQIKHLVLDEELAGSIVGSVSSDRIIIVCKQAEQKLLVSLLTQIGWKARIQSVITEENLCAWYAKALRGKFTVQLGVSLLRALVKEMQNEFPSIGGMSPTINARHYENIHAQAW